jgi:CPA1 family monovalent cation:H+ antiporter
VLRRQLVGVARQAIEDLRRTDEIGDDAYRQVEVELDWLELSAGVPDAESGARAADG